MGLCCFKVQNLVVSMFKKLLLVKVAHLHSKLISADVCNSCNRRDNTGQSRDTQLMM